MTIQTRMEDDESMAAKWTVMLVLGKGTVNSSPSPEGGFKKMRLLLPILKICSIRAGNLANKDDETMR